MKIFCTFTTINVSKLIFCLVICIAKNLIWTTLYAILSILHFVFAPRFQIFKKHQWKAHLFSFRIMYKSPFKKIDPYDWFCSPGSQIWKCHKGNIFWNQKGTLKWGNINPANASVYSWCNSFNSWHDLRLSMRGWKCCVGTGRYTLPYVHECHGSLICHRMSYNSYTVALGLRRACVNRVCLTRPSKWSCGLFDRPLVAGCSTGHKPHPLHVNEWYFSQKKK